jgi:hypothetical protein
VKHLRTRYLFAGDVLDAYDKIKKTRIDRRETPYNNGAFLLTTWKRQPHRTREKPPMISIRKGLAEQNFYYQAEAGLTF